MKKKNRTEKENKSLDLEKENGLGWKRNIYGKERKGKCLVVTEEEETI